RQGRLASELVERDRQVANAFAGRVINRIGDRGSDTDDANLSHTLDTERIDDVVWLVDEDDVDIVDVSIHRHVVLGEIGVDYAPQVVINQRFLVQGHANAPDHAACNLVAGRHWVENASGGNSTDDARDANDAKLLIHLHFREHGRMHVARVRA